MRRLQARAIIATAVFLPVAVFSSDPKVDFGGDLKHDLLYRPIPYAIPVRGKPGFVISPFEKSKSYVDARGFSPGTEVKDPYSGRLFLVP